MKITMIPLARQEMLRAARWYDRRESALGDRLLDEVGAALRSLLEYPMAAAAVDLVHRRKLIDVFPYALIYRIEPGEIVIVAVANLRRRPHYWKRRMKGSVA